MVKASEASFYLTWGFGVLISRISDCADVAPGSRESAHGEPQYKYQH